MIHVFVYLPYVYIVCPLSIHFKHFLKYFFVFLFSYLFCTIYIHFIKNNLLKILISYSNSYRFHSLPTYLKSNVSEIKELQKGYNIGYSNAFTTKNKTKVAIIPCGYADGFNVKEQRDMFRKRDKLRYIVRDIKDSFKDKSLYVEIKTNSKEYTKCKVLGRVGMYHITVDITGKDVKIGDEVKLNVSPIFIQNTIRREYK